MENFEQPKDELIKFNSERLFYGMLYDPGSQVFNHFTECDQSSPMSFVISGGEGYDDFMKQFSTKHPDNYLNTEWVKVKFKVYVTKTKQKVDKGELYTVVMTEILGMDLNSQCK